MEIVSMELPIAPQQNQPDAGTLVRALRRTDVMLARTAATETVLGGATVFSNAQRPGVHRINCAAEVRVPAGGSATAVLDEIDAHFAGAGLICHALAAAELDWSGELAQAAEAHGYQRGRPGDVCLLGRYVPPAKPPAEMQIVPGRAVYPQLRAFWADNARTEYHADDALAEQLAATHIDYLDEPRLEVFVARIDGALAGLIAIVTLGDIGVIDNVYTAPAYRGRGVATRLLDYAAEHCARAMFHSVVLQVRRDNDAAKRLYAARGFAAVATHYQYVRYNPAES